MYSEYARSNYFKVKDRAVFDDYCRQRGLEVMTTRVAKGISSEELVGLCSSGNDGMPTSYLCPDTGELISCDVAEELGDMLPDGEVAVVMGVYNDNMRYVGGYAWAITNKELKTAFLSDIIGIAKGMTDRPGDVTDCAY